MRTKLTRTDEEGHDVSEMILGHNIEMCLGTASGLLSERLRNPKFLGPPNRMTGIAPHWMGTTHGTAAYELTPSGGINGSEAQLVRVFETPGGCHLVQNKVQVRAGEELQLELWARCWHKPVTIRARLLPLRARSKDYDAAEVVIDKPYFHRYTLPLTAIRDDNEARLQIQIVERGEVWFDQVHLRPKDEPHLCKEVVDTMADMRIPTLRFPGGIVVNAYHWKHGTGPVYKRPSALDAAFHHDWYLNYDFGLDEYLRLCADQGMVPAITANPATETPNDAEELATYCRDWFTKEGIELPLIHWHISNHPYGATTAHMTPEMYAGVVAEFAPRMKAAYPNCRIVAVMSWRDLDRKSEDAPWREALFGEISDLIDIVEVQRYGGVDPLAPPEEQVLKLADELSNVLPQLKAFIALCRERGVDWNVGIAEWNWWMQASHWDGREFEEPPTVLHCLFIAGMIHRLASLGPDLEVAHFYNLVNCMGILNRNGPDVEVTDSVRTFNLYRPALPGRFVPVALEGAEQIEALCLKNDTEQWIFLTNRSASEPAEVSLGDLVPDTPECTGYRGASPTGTFETINLDISANTIELPPLSIARIRGKR